MSKGAHAMANEYSESGDTDTSETHEVSSLRLKTEEGGSTKSSGSSTMTEAEIRSRLDAFAKELAQARRDRTSH
jgi:hypothetical protein